jgi:hypothetical protein
MIRNLNLANAITITIFIHVNFEDYFISICLRLDEIRSVDIVPTIKRSGGDVSPAAWAPKSAGIAIHHLRIN